LVFVLVQLKDYSGAQPEYEQAIKEDPNSQLAEYARQALGLLPSLVVKPKSESASASRE